MNERQRQAMKEYIRDNLTLDIKSYRGYYDENETHEITLKLEDEIISTVSIY